MEASSKSTSSQWVVIGRRGSGIGGCWLGQTYPKFNEAVVCGSEQKLLDRWGSMPMTAASLDVVSLLKGVFEDLAYNRVGRRLR